MTEIPVPRHEQNRILWNEAWASFAGYTRRSSLHDFRELGRTQERDFNPQLASLQIFEMLGVRLENNDQLHRHYAEFFGPRLLAAGTSEPLSPLNALPNVARIEQNAAPYINDVLPGLPVLAGSLAKPLLEQGWKVVAFDDIAKVFFTNNAGPEGRRNGDRMIRKALKFLVDSVPHGVVLRWGGDEILIMAPPQWVEQARVEHARIVEGEDVKVPDSAYFANFQGEVNLEPISMHHKQFDANIVKDQYHMTGKVRSRIEKLIHLAPHLVFLRDLIFDAHKVRIQAIRLAESLVYDPLLQGLVDEYWAKGKNDVRFFAHQDDLVLTLQATKVIGDFNPASSPKTTLIMTAGDAPNTANLEMIRSDIQRVMNFWYKAPVIV